jgi:hypothetical protein
MALKRFQQDVPQTVGHLPHASLVRIDQRVKEILRRDAAVQQARRAAERLKAKVR